MQLVPRAARKRCMCHCCDSAAGGGSLTQQAILVSLRLLKPCRLSCCLEGFTFGRSEPADVEGAREAQSKDGSSSRNIVSLRWPR